MIISFIAELASTLRREVNIVIKLIYSDKLTLSAVKSHYVILNRNKTSPPPKM